MSTISASLVKELRDLTGAAMMDCKKALEITQGDLQAAIDHMRKSGQAKAAKRAGRIAAEGVIVIATDSAKTNAAMLEVNCETDFVARDDSFKKFADALAKTSLNTHSDHVTKLMSQSLADSNTTCEAAREALVLKIGENIQARRISLLTFTSGCIGSYLHGNRIGVLVALNVNNTALAKDIAMHIAATNPLAIDESKIAADVIAKERDIFLAQAKTSGKPDHIIEKMVEGRLKKFMKEVSLIHQPFVKNPDQTVGDLLKTAKAAITAFVRFEVGEGIEKQTTDFAEEVNATLKGSI